MNKKSLMKQFFMRHMPDMLNGDHTEMLTQYYQSLRDSADDGCYDVTKYRHLAYDFFEGKVDNPREMVSYIFGTGKNKFWCFEHNIADYPMGQFNTLLDIEKELENIQQRLINEDSDIPYNKDYSNYNLWCCTSEPFQNIIINSVDFMVGIDNVTLYYDVNDEACNTKNDHKDEIMVDENDMFVDTAYHDDPIDELVKPELYRESVPIVKKYNQLMVDYIRKEYPNTIFRSVGDDDVYSYTFAHWEDAEKVSLENFFDDLNQFNIIDVEVSEITIDGKTMFEYYRKDLTSEYKELYHTLYDKHKTDMDNGVVKMPRKKMSISLKGLFDD